MEAKELRIGNWVARFGKTHFQITCVEEGNFPTLEPIELTEGWLIKLGFGYWEDVGQWYSPDEDCTLRLDHYTKGDEDKLGFFEDEYAVKVKYVHQLQNLYFALTGEELEIKD